MSKGLVSVIVPVYNREDSLKACLDGIREQTWKDLEVIVVDDGSTDRSREIIRDYAERDPRFRLLAVSHGGPSAARNAGIQGATGEFLTFVDSDDIIERKYIEAMAAAIGEADFCVSGYRIYDCAQDTCQIIRPSAGRFTLAELGKNVARYEKVLGGVAWKLVRRRVVAEHRLAFPPEVQYGEDTLFFFQYLSRIDTIVVVSEARYVYRRHVQSSLVQTAFREQAQINGFLSELEKLRRQTQSGIVRYMIAYWQALNLWVLALNTCYGVKGFWNRRKCFFKTARLLDMREKCIRLRHISGGVLVVKWTVLTNAFLPLNLLVWMAGRIRGWDRDYAPAKNA